MKSVFLLLNLLAISVAGSYGQISPVYTAKFQHALDSVCERYHIKGISVAIYRPDEGIWTGVYGESHPGVPIKPDMYLPIGSNTKTFTSAAMLKLQENGALNIDDTIGTWISHPNVDGQITIKQLLNHTSGLHDYTDNDDFFVALNNDYNRFWQPEEMFQFIDTMRAKPGATRVYCNTNYLLAGMIISKVTGKPVEQALRDLIISPQGLLHTYFYPQEQPPTPMPHGWTQLSASKPMEDMQLDYGYANTAFLSMASSAGAYVSTAEDNVKFWHLLMTGKIINSNSLAMMKEMIYLNSTTSYGLGLFRYSNLNGRAAYAHGGTCFGYLNENAYDSVSGVAITVLSNQDSIGNSMLFSRVVRTLHKITLEMPPTGLQEQEHSGFAVRIFPNPASDVLHIAVEEQVDDAKVTIYDMTGRVVTERNLQAGEQRISTAQIPSGLYIARISGHGRLLHQQQVKIVR